MALQLKRVLITDEVDPKCLEILISNGIEAVKDTSLAKQTDRLIKEIQNYDGLIVRSGTKVTADIINAGHRLKIIGRAGTGVDNIDCDAATKRGVIVMNTPGGNTMSAAELTCTMIMATSRHISQGTESLRAGRWDRKKFMGNEVLGKTLAIVGLGRIGKEVATRMQAFGMKTIGYDPIIPGSVSAEFGVDWLPLEQLWPQSDYVTVHTPLIPQTKNLIGEEVFSKCKRGMKVINCARGGIVDEDAMLKALESGQCGGAGLDVFLEEPPTNMALIKHPLVTSTPHLGASTNEAQSRVAEEIAEQFVDAMNGKSLFGAINAQAMINALSEDTRPWVSLGKGLGSLAAASSTPTASGVKVTVHTQGSGLQRAGSYLGAAVLMGLLKPVSQNSLNLVSAPALAKESGVQVSTTHSNDGDSQVTVSVESPGGSTSFSGTVAGQSPLVTKIGSEALVQGCVLSGCLLFFQSEGGVQALTQVAGALQTAGTSLQSFITTGGSGKAWTACHLSSSLTSTDSLKSCVQSAFTVCL